MAFCAQLAQELASYWDAPQHVFQLPWRAEGTLFQQRVAGDVADSARADPELWPGGAAVGQRAARSGRRVWAQSLTDCDSVSPDCRSGRPGRIQSGEGRRLIGVKRWLLRHEGRWLGFSVAHQTLLALLHRRVVCDRAPSPGSLRWVLSATLNGEGLALPGPRKIRPKYRLTALYGGDAPCLKHEVRQTVYCA